MDKFISISQVAKSAVKDYMKYEPKSADKTDTKAHEAKESKRQEKAEHVMPKAKAKVTRTDSHPGLRYR